MFSLAYPITLNQPTLKYLMRWTLICTNLRKQLCLLKDVLNAQCTNRLNKVFHSVKQKKKPKSFWFIMHYNIRWVRHHCTLLYRTSNPDECGITVLYTHEKVDSLNQELYNVQMNYLIENQVQKP